MNKLAIYNNSINSTEILRTLALKGVDVFDLRVFNLASLIEETNERLGLPFSNKVLSNEEISEKVIAFFLDKVGMKNVSYQDIEHFMSTFSSIRMKVVKDEKEEIFKVINNHKDVQCLIYLEKFVQAYFQSLGEDLDNIMLCHKLISYCSSHNIKIFDEISVFDEFKLEPLEEEFLNTISKSVKHIKYRDIFNKNNESSLIRTMMPRYGTRNEVAHVFKDILSNNYPQDECQIVLINKAGYTNELFKLSKELKLNLTYECGLPINLTDAYKLYKTLCDLEKYSFFDVNGYLSLFSSDSLDLEKLGVTYPREVAQLIGRMKIGFNKETNDSYLDKFKQVKDKEPEIFLFFLEKIDREILKHKDEVISQVFNVVNEFSKGLAYIIRTYVKDRSFNDSIKEESINFIADTIEYAETKLPKDLRKSYLARIDGKFIHHNVFSDDAIHVVDIRQAFSSVRKHTYIIGLNASFYPGSLNEDFLFSDKLYEVLCGVKDLTNTSLDEKNNYLKSVIDTYLGLGVDLYLSYNCQEVREVRDLNPCSVLLDYADIFFNHKAEPFKELKEKASFYDDELSCLSSVSKIAIENNSIKTSPLGINQVRRDSKALLEKQYSPSKLSTFLQCPLKFYLDSIEYIDNVIEYDPVRQIGGNRFGDLLHFVIQNYVNNHKNWNKDEINSFANIVYDLYTNIDRSITDDSLEKNIFLKNVLNTYEFLQDFDLSDSNSEVNVGYGEEKTKIGNICFRGSIDLITKDKSGNNIIVDFKTGKSIEHITNDVESCVQGLIYSQLFEKVKGKHVSKLIFFYTRLNMPITFDNPCGNEAKNALEDIVGLFEQALSSLQFDINPKNNEDYCKYCKYRNICKREKKDN